MKNHLSTRHRTEIHLYRPEDQTKVGSPFEEGSGDAVEEISNQAEKPLDTPTLIGPETASTLTAPGSLAVVSAQSKSAKA